jgi:hypothetical protein
MNIDQKLYYREMLRKDRLFPVVRDGRLVCFITYHVDDDISKFFRNPWEAKPDNPSGKKCYISQLITDKHRNNPKLSYGIWKDFKGFIKFKYPKVQEITWRRYSWRKNKVDTYCKNL